MNEPERMAQHSIRFPGELWDDLRDAAAVATVQRSDQVTRSDLVREACRAKVKELLNGDGRSE